ncbi:hypothetical protein [Psychromonas sp. KJ10-2]|uniref:hypothetical protein n=1 Tax=Psychromonas sp. KJ10-2 TaxID=3391822 RepID=UPI0039B4698C
MVKGYQKDRSSEPHIQSKFDDNKVRLLTVPELCKAQSVPLHLVNEVSPNISYEGLGQGIDYLQGVGVGMVIARDVLNGY